jgi:hypothetical protein
MKKSYIKPAFVSRGNIVAIAAGGPNGIGSPGAPT